MEYNPPDTNNDPTRPRSTANGPQAPAHQSYADRMAEINAWCKKQEDDMNREQAERERQQAAAMGGMAGPPDYSLIHQGAPMSVGPDYSLIHQGAPMSVGPAQWHFVKCNNPSCKHPKCPNRNQEVRSSPNISQESNRQVPTNGQFSVQAFPQPFPPQTFGTDLPTQPIPEGINLNGAGIAPELPQLPGLTFMDFGEGPVVLDPNQPKEWLERQYGGTWKPYGIDLLLCSPGIPIWNGIPDDWLINGARNYLARTYNTFREPILDGPELFELVVNPEEVQAWLDRKFQKWQADKDAEQRAEQARAQTALQPQSRSDLPIYVPFDTSFEPAEVLQEPSKYMVTAAEYYSTDKGPILDFDNANQEPADPELDAFLKDAFPELSYTKEAPLPAHDPGYKKNEEDLAREMEEDVSFSAQMNESMMTVDQLSGLWDEWEAGLSTKSVAEGVQSTNKRKCVDNAIIEDQAPNKKVMKENLLGVTISQEVAGTSTIAPVGNDENLRLIEELAKAQRMRPMPRPTPSMSMATPTEGSQWSWGVLEGPVDGNNTIQGLNYSGMNQQSGVLVQGDTAQGLHGIESGYDNGGLYADHTTANMGLERGSGHMGSTFPGRQNPFLASNNSARNTLSPIPFPAPSRERVLVRFKTTKLCIDGQITLENSRAGKQGGSDITIVFAASREYYGKMLEVAGPLGTNVRGFVKEAIPGVWCSEPVLVVGSSQGNEI